MEETSVGQVTVTLLDGRGGRSTETCPLADFEQGEHGATIGRKPVPWQRIERVAWERPPRELDGEELATAKVRVLADDGDIEQALVWLARSIEVGNDEFVAGVIPALKAHPDPSIQALGEAAARQSGKPAPEGMDGAAETRNRGRFSLGWLFGPSGAPAR